VGITEIPGDVGALIGADEVEGETYSCGIFTVPQFWDDPDEGNIDLRFSVVNATGEDPEPDPLLFLAGGCGGVEHRITGQRKSSASHRTLTRCR
jgi:hypothetical protein